MDRRKSLMLDYVALAAIIGLVIVVANIEFLPRLCAVISEEEIRGRPKVQMPQSLTGKKARVEGKRLLSAGRD